MAKENPEHVLSAMCLSILVLQFSPAISFLALSLQGSLLRRIAAACKGVCFEEPFGETSPRTSKAVIHWSCFPAKVSCHYAAYMSNQATRKFWNLMAHICMCQISSNMDAAWHLVALGLQETTCIFVRVEAYSDIVWLHHQLYVQLVCLKCL